VTTATIPHSSTELDSLPDDAKARCGASGVTFARLHTMSSQRRPLLVTSVPDFDALACDALPAAGRLLAVKQPVVLESGTALAHAMTSR
jgi:hypothetical protein